MKKIVSAFFMFLMFMVAHFSPVAALPVSGDAIIVGVPSFSNKTSVDVDWVVTDMVGPSQNILMWSRIQYSVPNAYSNCTDVATIIGGSDASGTFTYPFSGVNGGNTVEFIITIDDSLCGGNPIIPSALDKPLGMTVIDSSSPTVYLLRPPSFMFNSSVSCNAFEFWGLASDRSSISYSGFGSWNQEITGTFASPAPVGQDEDLLSWPITFPPTASGDWAFSVTPEDAVGNKEFTQYFRNATVVTPDELEDCITFNDVSGHHNEIYIRYLADLGILNGFLDGSFRPDDILTRAEASALVEISNGYNASILPTSPPSTDCTFSDVSNTDWYSGWIWQACSDGFMKGVGNGLFDPNNLLTRGQIVTVLNNVANTFQTNPAILGGFIFTPNPLTTLYQYPIFMREAAWTDVSIGDYYALSAQKAYNWGIVDGTTITTFSPDLTVTRGEFSKMLYRALSRST